MENRVVLAQQIDDHRFFSSIIIKAWIFFKENYTGFMKMRQNAKVDSSRESLKVYLHQNEQFNTMVLQLKFNKRYEIEIVLVIGALLNVSFNLLLLHKK